MRQSQKRRTEKARALSPEEIAAGAQRYTERARAEAQQSAAKYVAGQDVRKLPSALISMRALSAAQRRNGTREDRVAYAYSAAPGTEKDEDTAVRVNNVDAPLTTQAAEAGSGEVLFGVDASTTVREEHDGFNSTKILTKIKNPHIAGSTTTSWLTKTMDRAVSADANLGQLGKGLNMVGNYTNFEDIKTIGNDRPHRDLYYAWLTGRTTYRTPNPMLKKTLAAAGFNGEEMPRRVFDTSLNGTGLGIDPGDVAADAKTIRERMEKDKSCQAQLLAGNDSNGKAYASMKKSVGSVGGSFPRTCAEVLASGSDSGLRNHLNNIRTQCRAINNAYAALSKSCNVAYKAGECKDLSGAYSNNFATFKKKCEEEYDKCMGETDEEGNAVNSEAGCAQRRDEKTGSELCAGVCEGQTIEADVRYKVTGYDNNEDAEDSTGVKVRDSGNNETGYVASQNVQNIIETLTGKIK